MTATGKPDDVVRRVQQYRDASVRLSPLRSAAAHQTQRLIDLFVR